MIIIVTITLRSVIIHVSFVSADEEPFQLFDLSFVLLAFKIFTTEGE